MSNILIKGNQQITYFTLDGSQTLSLANYSGKLKEVHTINPNNLTDLRANDTLSIWVNDKVNRTFTSLRPGKTYIAYAKTGVGDFSIVTDGVPSPIIPDSLPINGGTGGKPNIIVYPSRWSSQPISQYSSSIRVVFSPNQTMLRAWIPNVNAVAFSTFDPGKGYTIWARQSFSLQNPDYVAPQPTPTQTPIPAPQPTPTPSVAPQNPTPTPTRTPTPTPSVTPSSTPLPTPTPTVEPEAYINLTVISQDNVIGGTLGASAAIWWNEEWSNPTQPQINWRRVPINVPGTTNFLIPLPKRRYTYDVNGNLITNPNGLDHDGIIQFRVQPVAGTVWKTDYFDAGYGVANFTGNGSQSLYVTNRTLGSTKTAVVYLREYTNPDPTSTPVPTPTSTPVPTPTRTPTPTPNPTSTPTRTPNPTSTPTPTPTSTVPPEVIWTFDNQQVDDNDGDPLSVFTSPLVAGPAGVGDVVTFQNAPGTSPLASGQWRISRVTPANCSSNFIELNLAADLPYALNRTAPWPFGNGKTYGPWSTTKHLWFHEATPVAVDDYLFIDSTTVRAFDNGRPAFGYAFGGQTRYFKQINAGATLNINISNIFSGPAGADPLARVRLYDGTMPFNTFEVVSATTGNAPVLTTGSFITRGVTTMTRVSDGRVWRLEGTLNGTSFVYNP